MSIFNKYLEDKNEKSFKCNHEGRVEIVEGHEARSADVKKGDTFHVNSSYRNGEDTIRYYGSLNIKGSTFTHSPGFSGKKVDEHTPINHGKVVFAILKKNVTEDEDDFWATWSEDK